MTTVYSAKDRVDIGIGASKIIDVTVENKQMWAFIDIPRHPDKESVNFEDHGNGKMQVTNKSRWVVSLWPAQPFLGRKEYKTTTVTASVINIDVGTDIEELDLAVRTKNILRNNGVFTIESLAQIKLEHLKTFKGVGNFTYDKIIIAIDEWRQDNESTRII